MISAQSNFKLGFFLQNMYYSKLIEVADLKFFRLERRDLCNMVHFTHPDRQVHLSFRVNLSRNQRPNQAIHICH